MQSSHEVFNNLRSALEKRKFIIEGGGSFHITAYNKNYSRKHARIRMILPSEGFPDGVTILISDGKKGESDGWSLSKTAQNAIMREYMEYFDLTSEGAAIKFLPRDMGAFCDVEEIANLLTRAYSLAVTAE